MNLAEREKPQVDHGQLGKLQRWEKCLGGLYIFVTPRLSFLPFSGIVPVLMPVIIGGNA
jgi:hypothetical protein